MLLLIVLTLSTILAACGNNPEGTTAAPGASAGESRPDGTASTDGSSPIIGAPSDDPNISDGGTTDTSSSTGGGNEYEFKGIIFTEDYRAVEPFGGSYENGQLFARYLNRYRHFLGDDINIYNMIIPTAAAYYMPEKYEDQYGGKQLDKIDYVYEWLDGVTPVDIYDITAEHKNDEEEIYFRTEHHWTQYGAYWAAKKFAEIANVPFEDDLSKYTYSGKFYEDGTPMPFLGSLYSATQQQILKEHPDKFFYYEYPGEYTMELYSYDYSELIRTKDSCYMYVSDDLPSAWYMIFMDGDNYSIKINSDVKNGRTCVVFKDSFGNALVPMLLSSFETIYAIDIRKFPLNAIDFIQEVGATDVLFAVCAFTPMGSNYQYVETIRTAGGKYAWDSSWDQ